MDTRCSARAGGSNGTRAKVAFAGPAAVIVPLHRGVSGRIREGIDSLTSNCHIERAMIPDDVFDLAELSERAGVSQRTVRYYIQQGLLPSPEARGPGAHYGTEHLDRLRLIRSLQREHLPLAEIRRRLEELGPEDIRRLSKVQPKRPPGDAREYIRGVLSEGMPRLEAHSLREQSSPMRDRDPGLFHKPKPRPPGRSQWDRITLGPDVEIHIRRPLAREQIKQVEQLLKVARNIFGEEPP